MVSTPVRAGRCVLKIISGGQTGVDRAALDVALEFGIPCGGACPKGRRAEDGCIPAHYPLDELASPRYEDRTRENVHRGDATLVLTWGAPSGGTAATIRVALDAGRPFLVCDLSARGGVEGALKWVREGGYGVLNVAGPRASRHAEVTPSAAAFIRALVEQLDLSE